MKKLRLSIIMAAAIGLCITANCQSRSDSSVIATKDLRRAAILIEQGKGCIAERKLIEKQVGLLNERISLKDSSIDSYKITIVAYDSMVTNYKKGEQVFRDEMIVIESAYKNEIRRQKRKSFAMGGVIVGLVYLLFK